MAEEVRKEAAPQEGTANNIDATEVDRIRQENMALKEKAEKYDKINQKYQEDGQFRETLLKAWNGEYGAAAKAEAEKTIEAKSDGDLSAKQIAALEKRVAEYEGRLGALAENFVGDKVMGHRDRINAQYEQIFSELAEKDGYEVGSPEYNVLYKNAIHEGTKLAKKYGLVDKNGNTDPLLKLTPKLMEEAYKNGVDEFTAMGYDIKERKRQLADKKRTETFKRKEDELKKLIDSNKDKLKTISGRGKFLEEQFRKRLRETGNSFEDLV